MPVYEYKIIAGYNNTPVNIEGIAVAGATGIDTVLPNLDTDTHFFVRSLGQYDVSYQFTAGGVTQNGYPVIRWQFPLISDKALSYFISTYGQGSSQGGKVTINTRLDTSEYVEKNAILYITRPNTFTEKIRPDLYVYQNVEARLAIVGDTS